MLRLSLPLVVLNFLVVHSKARGILQLHPVPSKCDAGEEKCDNLEKVKRTGAWLLQLKARGLTVKQTESTGNTSGNAPDLARPAVDEEYARPAVKGKYRALGYMSGSQRLLLNRRDAAEFHTITPLLSTEAFAAGLVPQAGFNPSLALMPPAMATRVHARARYLATLRHQKSRCWSFGAGDTVRRVGNNGSSVLLLDEHLRVLDGAPLMHVHGHIPSNAEDVRLFVRNETVMLSYMEYPTGAGRWHLADLLLSRPEGRLEARVGKARAAYRNDRNLGLISRGDEIHAMWWFSDEPVIRSVASVEPATIGLRVDDHVEGRLHNSINPLFLPEEQAYLIAGHYHNVTINAVGQYYYQVLALMDVDPPYRVRAVSPPICLPSTEDETLCESVQFVASIVQEVNQPGSVLISYGINDCEAAVARLSLPWLLTFIKTGQGARILSRVPSSSEDRFLRR